MQPQQQMLLRCLETRLTGSLYGSKKLAHEIIMAATLADLSYKCAEFYVCPLRPVNYTSIDSSQAPKDLANPQHK